MWGWIQKPWQEGDESQNWGEKNRKLWGNIHYTKNIWGGILALIFFCDPHGIIMGWNYMDYLFYFWGDEQMNIHL